MICRKNICSARLLHPLGKKTLQSYFRLPSCAANAWGAYPTGMLANLTSLPFI